MRNAKGEMAGRFAPIVFLSSDATVPLTKEPKCLPCARGAGIRWTPLSKTKAPTDPAGENAGVRWTPLRLAAEAPTEPAGETGGTAKP